MCVCVGGGGGDNIKLHNCIHFLRHKVLLCSPAQLKVATGAPSINEVLSTESISKTVLPDQTGIT